MDLSKVKDILKIVKEKLSIFRNNMPLLISVIIAFAAVLLFVPAQLLSSGLKKEIQEKSIAGLANKLNILKNNPVSKTQLEEAQKSLDEITKDTNEIELEALHSTQRELLSPNIFNLDPNDANSTFSPSVFYDFGRIYCDKIDEFIAAHNARTCPTQTELDNELQASGVNSLLQPGGIGGFGGSNYDTMDMQQKIQGMLVDQVCKKRALESFVYIEPTQISGYDFWAQFKYSSWDEDIINCWFSQLGYWVIQDVFDTIVKLNTGHESLIDAPIKRLMTISFSDYDTLSVGTGLGGQGAGMVKKYTDRPQYVFSTDSIPKETLTGRYCGEDYDVIHFRVRFVVRTKDFMRVIQELCSAKEHKYIDESKQVHTYKHNQITILGMSLRSVDMNSTKHELYRYGDDNVSELELSCEYLFYVNAYLPFMPKPVQKLFGGI
jgi:hypothetical protein